MIRRVKPTLARLQAAALEEEFPLQAPLPCRRASRKGVFRAAVQSEEVEQEIVFSQSAAGAGGPLAAGRYRR